MFRIIFVFPVGDAVQHLSVFINFLVYAVDAAEVSLLRNSWMCLISFTSLEKMAQFL